MYIWQTVKLKTFQAKQFSDDHQVCFSCYPCNRLGTVTCAKLDLVLNKPPVKMESMCTINASVSTWPWQVTGGFQGQYFPPAVKLHSHSLANPFQNWFIYWRWRTKPFGNSQWNVLQIHNTSRSWTCEMLSGVTFCVCFSKKVFYSFSLLEIEGAFPCDSFILRRWFRPGRP